MAVSRVPLNKFRSKYYNITTALSAIYFAPAERAGILINAHVANPTSNDINVTMCVSGTYTSTAFPLVSNFPVPASDARSLVTGRVVLQGVDGASITSPDVLLVGAQNEGLVLSLGFLETKNTD
jgi:hypothetical protein